MTLMKAVNTLRIKKGKADKVLALFAKPKSVHMFEGFILMEVLEKEHTEEYDEVQICTTWDNEAYFEAWRESRAKEKSHKAKTEQKEAQADSLILSTELTTFKIVNQHYPS